MQANTTKATKPVAAPTSSMKANIRTGGKARQTQAVTTGIQLFFGKWPSENKTDSPENTPAAKKVPCSAPVPVRGGISKARQSRKNKAALSNSTGIMIKKSTVSIKMLAVLLMCRGIMAYFRAIFIMLF